MITAQAISSEARIVEVEQNTDDGPKMVHKMVVPCEIHEGWEKIPDEALNDDDGVTVWLTLDPEPLPGREDGRSPLDFSVLTLRTMGMTNDDLYEPEGLGDTMFELKFPGGKKYPRVYRLRENPLNSEAGQKVVDAFAAAFAKVSEDDR